MSVSRNMELRHLTISHVLRLSKILDENESWIKLMEKIPKNLADISQSKATNFNGIQRKYSTDEIRSIEQVSKSQHCSPTTILFDEWGTSGRKRATIGDLLELLIIARLYRAADFVAKDILHQAPPPRPSSGPCAKIDISIPPDEMEPKAIESLLDNVSYPNSSGLMPNGASTINDNNKDYNFNISVDMVKEIKDYFLSTVSEQSTFVETDLIKFSNTSIYINESSAHSDNDNDVSCDTQQQNSQQQSVLQLDLSSLGSSQSSKSDVSNEFIELIQGKSYPNSSALKIATDMSSESTMDNVQNDSFILPDIDSLQIKDQSVSANGANSEITASENSEAVVNDSVYIPNLSLLNGS